MLVQVVLLCVPPPPPRLNVFSLLPLIRTPFAAVNARMATRAVDKTRDFR